MSSFWTPGLYMNHHTQAVFLARDVISSPVSNTIVWRRCLSLGFTRPRLPRTARRVAA